MLCIYRHNNEIYNKSIILLLYILILVRIVLWSIQGYNNNNNFI